MNKLKDNEKKLIDRYYGETDSEPREASVGMVTVTDVKSKSGREAKGKTKANAKTIAKIETEIKVNAEAEAEAEPDTNSEAEDFEFEIELNKSMELMNVFCDDDIKVPNDFFSIIEKAEEIKTKKESNREFAIFILASLGILLSIAAITIQVGVKIFIIMQVALYFILPISLIPISIAAVKRGEAR